MSQFTVRDLRRILESCSGVVEEVDWDSVGILDTPFEEFGYDSLALLEFAAWVQREYRVRIPDDAALTIKTPRAALDYINQCFAEV